MSIYTFPITNKNIQIDNRNISIQGENKAQNIRFSTNKIIDAIYEAAPDETYDTKLYEIAKYAWDDWGSSEKLLTLTDEEIKAYAEGWF
jgi:hypothetical protein